MTASESESGSSPTSCKARRHSSEPRQEALADVRTAPEMGGTLGCPGFRGVASVVEVNQGALTWGCWSRWPFRGVGDQYRYLGCVDGPGHRTSRREQRLSTSRGLEVALDAELSIGGDNPDAMTSTGANLRRARRRTLASGQGVSVLCVRVGCRLPERELRNSPGQEWMNDL